MFENVVKILDINGNLLGTGLLLDSHAITVDHILDHSVQYYIDYMHEKHFAYVVFRGGSANLDIAVLSVNLPTRYKPNLIRIGKNSKIDLKGFPQGEKYKAYTEGRNIEGRVISFNFIGTTDFYSYESDFFTILASEDVTEGFSGAPVFCKDKLAGLVARKHVDDSPQKFNVIPISYFLEVEGGAFCGLFGEYIDSAYAQPRQSLRNFFHFQSEMISFYGREEQIDQLTQFCFCNHDILWWAITGVGGIGKSRLAFEFAKKLEKDSWAWEILSSYDYGSLNNRTEHIGKNLLLILDYVQQNIYEIGKWLFTLSQKRLGYKIRILLLERYGKSFKSSKWVERLNEKNCKYDALFSILYNPRQELDPPFLELFPIETENLKQIAHNYSSRLNKPIDDFSIEKIIAYLEALDPISRRPLYFIFLIDAWISTGGNLTEWNKAYILENILERELHRIRVIIRNVVDDDLLIEGYLNILAYSTILDGLIYPDEVQLVSPLGYQRICHATAHFRKDIILLFQQIGLIYQNDDGDLVFEGLKPDLLGEFYILKIYSKQNPIGRLIQNSFVYPRRFFSFFNRFLDDYSSTEAAYQLGEEAFRAALSDLCAQNMSEEQMLQYAKFLCERTVRDNRKHAEQCLKRLKSLYAENNDERIAIEYARGLSNMVIEYNLKKSRSMIRKLEYLYNLYQDTYEITIEYAQALVSVIERKSIRASIEEFEQLKALCNQSCFSENLDMSLCYARALSALCRKHSNAETALDICYEIKAIARKFSQSEELIFIFAKSLCGIETTTENLIVKIFSELSLLSERPITKAIFDSFLKKIFTVYQPYWSGTYFWKKSPKFAKVALLNSADLLVDELNLCRSDLLSFVLEGSDKPTYLADEGAGNVKRAFLKALLKISADDIELLGLLSRHWISVFDFVTSGYVCEEEANAILILIHFMETFDFLPIDENYETLLMKCPDNMLTQNQYIEYLRKKKSLSFEYAFHNLKSFYLSSFTELNKYFSHIIPSLAESDSKRLRDVMDYLSAAFSENSCKEAVAEDFAKVIFLTYRARAIDPVEACSQFEALKDYSGTILWYQKTLSCIASDKASADEDFRHIIDQQFLILRQNWSVKIAAEYCKFLAQISVFVSLFETKKLLEQVCEIRDAFCEDNTGPFQNAVNRMKQHIFSSKIPSGIKRNLLIDDPITYLNFVLKTLNDPRVPLSMIEVNAVIEEARLLYKRFPDEEAANLLCKALCFQAKTAPNGMLSKITIESLMIYKRYPSVLKIFIKILSYTVPNCALGKEIVAEIEDILVSRIEKNTQGKEVYKVISFILHSKNSQNPLCPVINLPAEELFVSSSVSYTQSEIDSAQRHFHIWETLDKPIEAIHLNGRYILVDGYARWLVAQKNEMAFIPTRVLAEYG